jgi:hypothetical protein
MSNGASCIGVLDTDGLYAICELSDNEKQVLLDKLKLGEIEVPIIVLKEFKNLYPDKVNLIEESIYIKIKQNEKYRIGAASIADKLNSKFPRSSYDSDVELITAAIAKSKNYSVITSIKQSTVYKSMEVGVITIEQLIVN